MCGLTGLGAHRYDLDADPHQLKNLAKTASASEKAALHAMAVAQFGCSGTSCS